MVKPLQHIAWLGASVYEMPLEDVNNLLEAVAWLRSSPVTELVGGLQEHLSNHDNDERSSRENGI